MTDELNMAVLHKVQEALGPDTNATIQWLHNTPRAWLDEHQAKITALRSWAKSLQGDIRRAYLKWIEFYQRGLERRLSRT